jgi:hypothetical protein
MRGFNSDEEQVEEMEQGVGGERAMGASIKTR